MKEYIVGIDIGSSKVCAAMGKLDKQGNLQIVCITSAECSGLKKAVVVNIDITTEAIRNCLNQLQKIADIDIDSVYISIPGGMCDLINNKAVIAITSEDNEIRKSDVNRVLEAAKIVSVSKDEEIIGVIPEQFIVDGYDSVRNPVGMSGFKLGVDAKVIAAQSTVVSNLLKSIEKAQLKVDGIVLQPIGTAESVLKREETEIGTMLIDVGAETTDISIYKSGNLCYTKMIPIGGSSITNDISICLKISFDDAEKLKIKYGNVKKVKDNENYNIKINSSYNGVSQVDYNTLGEIIEARVEEMIYFIYDDLKNSEFYESISNVVIVGGGISLLKGIEELVSRIIEKPARIGAPEYVGTASPIYSAAVGILKDVVKSSQMSSTNNTKEHSFEKVHAKEKESSQNQDGILSKVKNFLSDFF